MEVGKHPVAGADYPSTFQELDEWFRGEVACRAYIRRLRWPGGFCCPHCGVVGEPWEMAGGWLRCRACRRETSVTAGTIFEGTRKPLRTWFLAMWFVTSQKNGVSALGLQRALGLGSYETGSRGHATRPQSRRLAQTVVVGDSPGRHPAPTSRLLPRRIHFSLQSTSITGPWTPVPPPRPAGGGRRTGPLPLHHQTQHFRQSRRIGGMKGIPTFPNNAQSRSSVWL